MKPAKSDLKVVATLTPWNPQRQEWVALVAHPLLARTLTYRLFWKQETIPGFQKIYDNESRDPSQRVMIWRVVVS